MKAAWGSTAKGAQKARKKKLEPEAPPAPEMIREGLKPVEKDWFKCPACGFRQFMEVAAGHACGGACNYRVQMARE